MDRSFLSQSDVVAAARNFVCVRLMTYESGVEGEFLKAFNVTRSGELENTVFTIVAPDGVRPLVRSSRSTKGTFRDAAQMAEAMAKIATANPGRADVPGLPELPTVASVRLAINVAACDNLPLVVVVAADEGVRRELIDRLRVLAWGDKFVGRFIYTTAAGAGDLALVEGEKPTAGVCVIQPTKFGLSGKVIAGVGATNPVTELIDCLVRGSAAFHKDDKTFASHVQAGKRQGLLWETAIPVTDPMEQRARARKGGPPGD